ncbi:hypothetical protein BT69DRAFT_1279015, partial [Atractiella rhizophila]
MQRLTLPPPRYEDSISTKFTPMTSYTLRFWRSKRTSTSLLKPSTSFSRRARSSSQLHRCWYTR